MNEEAKRLIEERQQKRAAVAQAAADASEPTREADEPETDGDETFAAPAAPSVRERLGHLDPQGMLPDEELLAIEAEAKELAEMERKEKARKDARSGALMRARVENNLVAASKLASAEDRRRWNELVTFRVNLPAQGDSIGGFRVDGRVFQHGQVYTEKRAVFESLLDTHYRAHVNEVQFRTLDQHKIKMTPGFRPAQYIIGQSPPPFEVLSNG